MQNVHMRSITPLSQVVPEADPPRRRFQQWTLEVGQADWTGIWWTRKAFLSARPAKPFGRGGVQYSPESNDIAPERKDTQFHSIPGNRCLALCIFYIFVLPLYRPKLQQARTTIVTKLCIFWICSQTIFTSLIQ